MKPRWKYAPRWAKWLARDYNGDWWWHQRKPYVSGYKWINAGKMQQAVANENYWTETVEERPK